MESILLCTANLGLQTASQDFPVQTYRPQVSSLILRRSYKILLYLNANYVGLPARLVQITSRDVHKYAIFTKRSNSRSKITLILPSKQYYSEF